MCSFLDYYPFSELQLVIFQRRRMLQFTPKRQLCQQKNNFVLYLNCILTIILILRITKLNHHNSFIQRGISGISWDISCTYQWKLPDDGQESRPKHFGVFIKNRSVVWQIGVKFYVRHVNCSPLHSGISFVSLFEIHPLWEHMT
jgi:hypothetical protein